MVSNNLIRGLSFSVLALTLIGSNPDSAQAISKTQLQQQINGLATQFNNFTTYVNSKFNQTSSQTGAQGPQGVKGDKGDKGDQGAVGPVGPIGPQGPAGRDFVPSRTAFILDGLGCATRNIALECLDADGCKINVRSYPKIAIPGIFNDQVIRREFNIAAEQSGISLGNLPGTSGFTSAPLTRVTRTCGSVSHERFTQDSFNWVIQSGERHTLLEAVHYYKNPNGCGVLSSGAPILSKNLLSVVNYNPQGCNTAYNTDSNPYTDTSVTFKGDPSFKTEVEIID